MNVRQFNGKAPYYIITNKNADALVLKFNGNLYTFPPKQEVFINEEEGRFFFGLGGSEEEKYYAPLKFGLSAVIFDGIEVKASDKYPANINPAKV